MSDTTTGAARPAISDADMSAAIEDLDVIVGCAERTFREISDRADGLSAMLRRWRGKHGAAFDEVGLELRRAVMSPTAPTAPLPEPPTSAEVQVDLRAYAIDHIETVADAMRDMVSRSLSIPPTIPFPGALPADDDLADVLARLDAIGDDGVPCPELLHSGAWPCRWCGGTARVSIGALTRYIAETGHVDRARAVLGLSSRPVPA